jgi:hypothetical protein
LKRASNSIRKATLLGSSVNLLQDLTSNVDDLQLRGIASAFFTTRAGSPSTVHLKKTDCFSVSSCSFAINAFPVAFDRFMGSLSIQSFRRIAS